MEKMYPVMMNLDRKRVAITGGGETALRKAKELAGTGAKITVISPGYEKNYLKYMMWCGSRKNLKQKISRERVLFLWQRIIKQSMRTFANL